MSRRSRLVGLPDPFARARNCWTRCRRAFSNSSGGVLSWQYPAAAFAFTRIAGTPRTSSVRRIKPCCTTTVSPVRTSRDALAGCPFTVTVPARQPSVARLRVLKMRTDQSHLSRRSDSDSGFTGTNVATVREPAKNFAQKPVFGVGRQIRRVAESGNPPGAPKIPATFGRDCILRSLAAPGRGTPDRQNPCSSREASPKLRSSPRPQAAGAGTRVPAVLSAGDPASAQLPREPESPAFDRESGASLLQAARSPHRRLTSSNGPPPAPDGARTTGTTAPRRKIVAGDPIDRPAHPQPHRDGLESFLLQRVPVTHGPHPIRFSTG